MDWEVQAFPWEGLPILREQDVYRMYSVNSIMKRCREGMLGNSFPSIDPYEVYYLLNPDGDEAIRWAEDYLKWLFEKRKGLVGRAPSHQDLHAALDESELFFFLGHGSTLDRLICSRNLKTSKCPAALLMACGSASVALNGAYAPRGPCLSSMVAGAPFAIGNLWGVSCREAAIVGQQLLKSMLVERIEHHGATIGLMMRQARNKCTWPYTTGAAVVCYGVPTSLVEKEKSVSTLFNPRKGGKPSSTGPNLLKSEERSMEQTRSSSMGNILQSALKPRVMGTPSTCQSLKAVEGSGKSGSSKED